MHCSASPSHINSVHVLFALLLSGTVGALTLLRRAWSGSWRRRRRPGARLDRVHAGAVAKDKGKTALADIVARCEARWLLEDLETALQGDSEAMERVSDMLAAGYGARGSDPGEAAEWVRRAWAVQNYREVPGKENDSLQAGRGFNGAGLEDSSELSSEDEGDAWEDENEGEGGGGAWGKGSSRCGVVPRSRSATVLRLGQAQGSLLVGRSAVRLRRFSDSGGTSSDGLW